MRDKLHQVLWGTPYRPEYLCTPFAPHESGLRIRDEHHRDVTSAHVFLGYRPLLLGFWDAPGQDTIKLDWVHESGGTLATVRLRQHDRLDCDGINLQVYEGESGKQRFLSRSQQWRHNFRQRLKPRKDNVYLNPQRYNQVKAAYAVPRKISIVSVSDGARANVFPTDLNGPVGDAHYAISLRESGKAHEQVMQARRILITEMELAQSAIVYELGRNHMRPLRPFAELQEAPEKIGEFPVPRGVIRYRILERLGGKTISIHHIHLFKVLKEKPLQSEARALAHIHRDYATWRWRKHIPTEYAGR